MEGHNFFLYIDPGTGSMVVQALIAGFLGFLFIIKTYWQRIKSFFLNLFGKKELRNFDE